MWDEANATGLTKLEEVLYTEGLGQSGYDAAGRLGFYRFARYAPAWTQSGQVLHGQDLETYTHSYTLTYLARDGYLEDVTTGSSTNANFRTSSTDSDYDGAGRRISIFDTTVIKGAPDLEARRSLVYNAEGQVLLTKHEYKSNNEWLQGQAEDDTVSGLLVNKWTQFYNTSQWANLGEAAREALYDLADNRRATYVNGQQIASHTEAGTELNFSGNLTGFRNTALGRGQTQVQQGDTLGSIAQRVYGTSTLWYVLADANGLEQNSNLAAGTILTTPEVKTSTNDANTFRPYDPGEMTGPTTPTMPYMPPPDAGCGTVGMIIMVIIIIIVTIYTAGAASGAATAGATSTGTTVAGATASTAAAASTATAGVSTMSAGMAALSGGGGIMGAGTAIASSAVGGFVGSVAGQAAGSAMGVASFSWRQALSTGAAAGLTAGIGSTAAFGRLAEASNFVKGAVSAVSSNVVSQATNRVFGVETSFSWKSIAASAVSGGVAASVGPHISGAFGEAAKTEFGQAAVDFSTGMAGGIVSAHVRRAFGFDDKVSFGAIATDAFGSMLANRITGQHSSAAIRASSDQDSSDNSYGGSAAAGDKSATSGGVNPFGLASLLSKYGDSEPTSSAAPSLGFGFGLSNRDWSVGLIASDDYTGSISTGGATAQAVPLQVLAGGSWNWTGNREAIAETMEVNLDAAAAAKIRSDREVLRRLGNQQIWSYHFGEDRDALNRDRQNRYVNPVVAQVEAGLTAPLLSHEERVRRATAYSAESGVDADALLSMSSPHRAPVVNPYADMSADEFRRVLGASDRQAAWDFGKGLIIGTVEGLIQTAQMASPMLAAHTFATGGEFWTPFDGPASHAEAAGRIVAPFATLGIGGPGILGLLGRGGSASRGLSKVDSWQDVGVPLDMSKLKFQYVPPIASQPARSAATTRPAELFRLGNPAARLERTYDHGLNPQLYLEDVATHYGIRLRGSGEKISVVYDESISAGQLGVAYAKEGGKVIRIGQDAFVDQATIANTIAHELGHARDYLRGGVHKPHGFDASIGDRTPYGSGNALEAWIRGQR